MNASVAAAARFLLLALSFLLAPATSFRADAAAAEIPIRPPVAAGIFYPEDPARLERAVETLLAAAVPPEGDRPVAIVAPHAGYAYAGQICADAFRQAADRDYELIVLIGTAHRAADFRGISVYPGGGYRTPLGVAFVDAAAARDLRETTPAEFHPEVHAEEHSLEVLIPFVRVLFPGARILPVVLGTRDRETCVRFGRDLAGLLQHRRALIVASTDLSHYPDRDAAIRADRDTLRAMTDLDPERFAETVRALENQGIPGLRTAICGEAAVLAAMAAARELGATRGRVVGYANSGDTAFGESERVVGYGAVTFSRSGGGRNRLPESIDPNEPGTLSPGHRRTLLNFARRTLGQYLATAIPPLARDSEPALQARRGVFVTLKQDGKLRGCMGCTASDRPLQRLVGAMALGAAFRDSRFPPLTAEELGRTEIEISVLTPLREVDGPQAIRLGRDGLFLEKDGRSAAFLPRVAAERGWDRERLLSELVRKAGLPDDAWKSGCRISTFQAAVFGETDSPRSAAR